MVTEDFVVVEIGDGSNEEPPGTSGDHCMEGLTQPEDDTQSEKDRLLHGHPLGDDSLGDGSETVPGTDPEVGIEAEDQSLLAGREAYGCVICLDIEEGELIPVHPCLHRFHPQCLERHIQMSTKVVTCPLCRTITFINQVNKPQPLCRVKIEPHAYAILACGCCVFMSFMGIFVYALALSR